MALAADDPDAKARLAAFQQELERLGWSDERKVYINCHYAVPRHVPFTPQSRHCMRVYESTPSAARNDFDATTEWIGTV